MKTFYIGKSKIYGIKKLWLGFLDGEESFEAISKVDVYKFAPWMGIILYTCFYNALFVSMENLV